MYSEHKQYLTSDQEPIIALCTPRGSGAIALLRLSGDGCIAIADAMARLTSGKKLQECSSHTINFGTVVDRKGTVVDEILFLLMRGPKTFTGQDTVELSCHNNQFIIDQIIQLACDHGARLARAGEFSKRSFLNGKRDLLQVEAINDIIHAQTEEALRRSMEQLQGSLSHHLAEIQEKLFTLLTFAEASFEFLEEEQRDLSMDATIKTSLNQLLHDLTTLQEQFLQQQTLRQGVSVALIGSVNAGKSTLFNALLKKDRAIVTDIAGTTRDSIEASLYKQGIFWTYVDTAGLRSTSDIIEQEGIERARLQAKASDVVLIVYDTSKPLTTEEETAYRELSETHAQKAIIVLNKIDQQHKDFLLPSPNHTAPIPHISISAQHKQGIQELEALIDQKIQILFSHLNAPFLLTQRQASIVDEIKKIVQFIVNSSENSLEYEIMAYHLTQALEKVAELTGKNIHEKMLDTIFSGFCVGK